MSLLSPNDRNRPYALRSPTGSTTSLLPANMSRAPFRHVSLGEQTPTRGPVQLPTLGHSHAATSPPAPVQYPPSLTSLSAQFSLSPDPSAWGAKLDLHQREADDYLHNPDPRRDRRNDLGGTIFTARGVANLGCLSIVAAGLLTLFAGYPIITFFQTHDLSSLGGFGLGGTNATGQVPDIPGKWGLIDEDTPQDARTITPITASGKDWELIFSDEFNVDGRSFYPGDDPYWEAVDMHYWGTNNMEWYDPEAITTKDGHLTITLSQKETHGLHYQGGLMTTWNKFCFTGGMVVTSLQLPGVSNVVGLWPAVWMMGNLGRTGYGASLDGMWPYSYDACDVGTVKNQTVDGLPHLATVNGDKDHDWVLSYLPGQRLSRCTCPGESHPGPVHSDGSYVGRSAPEIDIIEAQVQNGVGEVSQSGQWGPFNMHYEWDNATYMTIYNETVTQFNTYTGGIYQQATSAVSITDQNCYEFADDPCFAVYGIEYKPGFDDAYITWISNNNPAWTLKAPGMGPDSRVEISARPVPQEPMYLIANLGMSKNFGDVDLTHLTFPTKMSVDYIRVYQDPDNINIGCDPIDFPTAAYINEYLEAYTNPNLTTWVDDYKQVIPKNSFLGEC